MEISLDVTVIEEPIEVVVALDSRPVSLVTGLPLDRGPKGDPGPEGPPGPPGPAGTEATITVGSTTTLAAGQPATVINTGTASAAVLEFGIPRGADGEDVEWVSEQLAGETDGMNPTFAASYRIEDSSVYLNGDLVAPADYEISTDTVIFNDPPEAGDHLQIRYRRGA